MTHLCSLQCEEQSICIIYKYKWFWSTKRYGNKQLKLSTVRENHLLLSITGSTGCGSPFLKNARAYNSPSYVYFIIKLKYKEKNVESILKQIWCGLTRALIFKFYDAFFSLASDFQYSFPCPFVDIPFISPEMNFINIKIQ